MPKSSAHLKLGGIANTANEAFVNVNAYSFCPVCTRQVLTGLITDYVITALYKKTTERRSTLIGRYEEATDVEPEIGFTKVLIRRFNEPTIPDEDPMGYAEVHQF
jgi:hypothetical protein